MSIGGGLSHFISLAFYLHAGAFRFASSFLLFVLNGSRVVHTAYFCAY
jgi:hypothetical protein